MQILVTGATGYVGSRLVARLLAEGHSVRAALAGDLDPANLWWLELVETVDMDVLVSDQVSRAVAGVDAAYYLIHGLGGDDFVEKDRTAAGNMAAALTEHGVGRAVYLSGIVPPVDDADLSDHISSRHEVERILTASTATTVTLRAAILVGAASTSFEIVRQISDRLPVQAIPTWMDSDVQPIAVVDALEALVGALTVDTTSRSYDIGGPDRLSYSNLIRMYAEVAGLHRLQVPVPGLPTALVGRLAGLLTDVPGATVESLVESLHHDMVCAEEDFREDLLPQGHRLLGLREAVERALASQDTGTAAAELDPMRRLPHDPGWAPEPVPA